MKKVLSLLLSVIAALTLLGACQKGPSGEQTAVMVGGETSPEDRESVVIGFPEIPPSFDPLSSFSLGVHGTYWVQILYSGLVQTDADMEIIPDLAESWEVSGDALSYSFRLKDGLKFSDGSPITPEDAAFSFKTAMESPSGPDLSMISEVSSDENTVTIRLKEPYSPFILRVCSIGIVPKAAYDEDFALNPVSSGPYVLSQYDVDQQFILDANPEYYGGAPGISHVIFVKCSDEDARMAAVKSGQVDITPTSAAIAGNTEVEGYCLTACKTVDNMGIAGSVRPDKGEVNGDGYPVGNNVTCDIAVRKALSYGIDRQKICDEALYGYATPAYSENDGMPWSNPECRVEFDPELAVRYLDDAGWIDSDGDGIREKDGVRASFHLIYFAGDSARQAVGMSLSNQARDNLGIEIIVEGAGEDVCAQRMFSDPMMLAWGSSNPMTSYLLFHSSNAGRADWYNPEFYMNKTVDGYLDKALHSRTLEEAIPFWQKAQWDGETGTSMRGDAPYIFLLNKTHLYWTRDGLDIGRQQIHAHGDSWPLVVNLREWRWK